MKTNNIERGPNKHKHNRKHAKIRYKRETRPGLVALYDIWPGNGAGPYLQPRSPHVAQKIKI